MKATSYINDAIIDKHLQSIKYYGTLRRYNCHSVTIFMKNLCDASQMSCDVAALPFQAHANYGTWPWEKTFFDQTGLRFIRDYLVFIHANRIGIWG